MFNDIYPQSEILETSTDPSDSSNELRRNVNVIVSFDMGWSKRGTGRNYDSLNGYGAIIGYMSKKVLDFTTRNRQCYLCDVGHSKADHDCRKNFEGSAKAMEADAGAQLVNNSEILQSVNLKVRVVIGDEDSSTIAAIRKGNDSMIYKLADNNHLIKNFAGDLYEMSNSFKELKKTGVIPHLKKCFSYAIAQNKNQTANLAACIQNIPDHMYNKHETCGDWCKRIDNSNSQTVVLKDELLYTKLQETFLKYANNASKFCVAASSQANESLNSMIVSKAPKTNCYSKSESADYRVSCAVLSKNEGDVGLLSVKKNIGLQESLLTSKHFHSKDKKRKYKSERKILKSSKLRRLELAAARKNMRKRKEQSEGVTYQRNFGINSSQAIPTQIFSHEKESNLDQYKFVYFDLETSGLELSHDILQIAAICDDLEFNIYILPTHAIPSQATKVNGISYKNNQLFYKNKQVEAMNLCDALLAFSEFLNFDSKSCVLVAHNGNRFDFPRLINAILSTGLLENFSTIKRCSDSMLVFKKLLPDQKGPGSLTLIQLASKFLNIESNINFHEALFDVTVMRNLVKEITTEYTLITQSTSFSELVSRTINNNKISSVDLSPLKLIVSRDIIGKIALAGFTMQSLQKIYNNNGKDILIKQFSKKSDVTNKPVVTKNEKVLKKILSYLEIHRK